MMPWVSCAWGLEEWVDNVVISVSETDSGCAGLERHEFLCGA